MKPILSTLLLTVFFSQMSFAQLSPNITSWIINTTGAKGQGPYTDTIEANVQIVQYSDSSVYISCTCIPGYDIGPWQGDPNVPVNQNFVFRLPRYPQPNTDSATATQVPLGHDGIWTNGVSIFNASDAMSYNNQGLWHRNAYYFEGSSFDDCLGHPQQQGEYHHHVNPKCLYDATDSTHHSPIIGYAFDGYPVYGAYGYANTDGTGGIKRMTPSFQFRSITTRDTLPNGVVCSVDSEGPAVSATYPLGDFLEDYEYVPGSGDLDFHNGRFCVTPDYPNGTYAYFVTVDSTLTPVYPYVLGLTYYGVAATYDIGPTSGHYTITEPTTIYSVDSSQGINNVSREIKFDLSPNPVEGYTYIYFDPNSANNIMGTLYNAKGQLMKTIQNMQPSISYALDMTSYPAGMYFLHLESGDVKVVQKVVKTK